MRVRGLLIFFALLLCPSLAAAEPSEPAKCDAHNSQPITFAAAHSDGTDLFDECVAIRGFRVGDAIFQDQTAVYRFSSKHQRSDGGVVGISFPAPDFETRMEEGIFYGRLESCLNVQQSLKRSGRAVARANRRGRDIILLHPRGFCTWNDGPSVEVDNWTSLAPIHWTRFTDESQRDALGDLQPVAADFEHSRVVDWLVEVATVGVCNPSRVEKAPGPAPFDQGELDMPDASGKWAKAIRTRCGIARSDVATFIVSPRSVQAVRDAKLDIVMCISMAAAKPSLPIATIDAGWGTERPYVCERAVFAPQVTSCSERGKCRVETWRYEFKDDWLVSGFWQDAGFREPS